MPLDDTSCLHGLCNPEFVDLSPRVPPKEINLKIYRLGILTTSSRMTQAFVRTRSSNKAHINILIAIIDLGSRWWLTLLPLLCTSPPRSRRSVEFHSSHYSIGGDLWLHRESLLSEPSRSYNDILPGLGHPLANSSSVAHLLLTRFSVQASLVSTSPTLHRSSCSSYVVARC